MAIAKNGLEAAQYQVALKQVEALTALGGGEGKQTIVLPSNAMDAFVDSFKILQRGSDAISDIFCMVGLGNYCTDLCIL